MHEFRLLVAGITAASLLAGGTAHAVSVKAGASCSKRGRVVVQNSLKYTCVKRSSKLVWSKGVPLPIPAPTPTPTPTPTPAPIVEPKRPQTMADLAADPSVVPYWAWQLASKSMVGGTAASLTVEFIVGPNSVKDTAVAERGIRAAATLFRGTPQPDRTSVILFSYRDRDWAQQQWQSLTPASGNVFELSGCTSDKQCSVGVGATNGVDRGVVLLSTNLVGASSNLTPGSLLAHEYTHVIQGSQFFGNPQASESWCCIGRWLPRYLIEGQANWAQSAAMHPDDFAAYKRERRKLLRNLTDPGKLESQGIDLAYLEGFLSFQGDAWQRYDGSRFYDLGMLFTESLVALQGPEDLMRVVQRTGGGMEFADAFQQVYRVPFADAVPYLAKAMLKLGNGSGM